MVKNLDTVAQRLTGKKVLPTDIQSLINFLFYVGLAVIVVLAVFGIVRGGYLYLVSADSASNKDKAKKVIQAALGGLLLGFGSWLILNTINPDILKFDPEYEKLDAPPVVEIDTGEIGYSDNFIQNQESYYDGSLPNIIWNDPNQQISRYFKVGDFTKGDPNRVPTDPYIMRNIYMLAQELDQLVDAWGGGSFVFTSGYRPAAVNSNIRGAATDSQHIRGLAVDIAPRNGDLQGLQQYVLRNWGGGVGIYGSFVHVDMRGGRGLGDSTEGAARW